MLAVLEVTFPFFALVLAGYVAVRARMLALTAIPALNAFVLYFALPCMLFRFGATTAIVPALTPGLVAVYLLCALVMVGFMIAVTLGPRTGWNDASFGALVGAFPNTGYMGVPLLVALLGPPAAAPAIATILIDLIVTSSLCVALSRLGDRGEHGAAEAARRALAGVVRNPLPWSILAGIAVHESGFAFPGPVDRTIGLLADAASPVALFTIGAVLARTPPEGAVRATARDWLPATIAKLLLHPLLVLAVAYSALDLGIAIDRGAITTIVLVAALPSASNVVMLAERFGADGSRIAKIVLATTAAAFLSFSGFVTLLR